jgi:hypothetical protein
VKSHRQWRSQAKRMAAVHRSLIVVSLTLFHLLGEYWQRRITPTTKRMKIAEAAIPTTIGLGPHEM